MYGLWLFKEIQAEYGYCKVEIYRKGYNGSQIEIGALAANSLTLSLENLGTITDPIGKSVCSFEIVDTEQISYDDFFTPDATAYKVVVSTRVGEGAYNTRWSGYVTPDFFAENLTYRTPISISVRDNIGYLNDVDFDMDATTTTIRNLIQSAFSKIATDYPMSLEFASQKQTAEGVLAIDATISTALLYKMSWYEAIEAVLHDLGLQMRWVDNNTIAVLDLSQIPEYYALQSFNFIGASGYRETLPAWRQLTQSQDYGLRENFFEGWIGEKDLTFVKEEDVTISGYSTSKLRYYSPNKWVTSENALTINYADYVHFGSLSKSEKERIYFTGAEKNTTLRKYMGWRQAVRKSFNPMKITFKALNSIQTVNPYSLSGLPVLQTFGPYAPGTAQFGLKVNILLHSGTKTYILRYGWEELNTQETDAIDFILSQLNSNNAREEECTISINEIPYDGEIELRIYGWYFIEATNWTAMPLNAVSYITDIVYTYDAGGSVSGQDASIEIGSMHNIKQAEDYIFGQVPYDCGGMNAYAGGLYKADGAEMTGFQRNANGVNYNLLELVGREISHFNRKNYNKLSGTIKNLDKAPLMFNRLFVREGKKYAPFAYSLSVISNEMDITTMQEVEPYETASYTEINSEVTTGGATVSGGNNTILQYSEEAGNAKRITELDSATEQEAKDAEIIIDNPSWPEAKKFHMSQIQGLFDLINVGTEDNPQYAVIPKKHNGQAVGIVSDTFITAGERRPGQGGSTEGTTTLGGLVNVEPIVDEISGTAKVLIKPANGTHWTIAELSELVGLDVVALERYLEEKGYAKKEEVIIKKDFLESVNGKDQINKDYLPTINSGAGIIVKEEAGAINLNLNINANTFAFDDNVLNIKLIDGGYID